MAAHRAAMIVSRNEILSLALKAARGAGVPLGHAEDFAGAVAYLLAVAPEEAAQVVASLAGPHLPVLCKIEGSVMRIASARVAMAAPVIVDALLSDCTVVVAAAVDAPALLEAALAVAIIERGLQADWNWTAGSCTVRRDAQRAGAGWVTGPVAVDDVCWAALQVLAAETYVPETAQSRASGAGADQDAAGNGGSG